MDKKDVLKKLTIKELSELLNISDDVFRHSDGTKFKNNAFVENVMKTILKEKKSK